MATVQDYVVTITARERAELLPVERDSGPLAAGEVAGRTLSTLISAGTELASCYQGHKFPAVPGYAAVFEVEAIGDDVKDIHTGDHVFCMGNHRSYQRVPEQNVVKVPEGLSPYEAVFARLMAVSMSTLTTTAARPPQKVLVTGLGPVGHLAAQIFAGCGYEVIACDPVDSRREMLAQVGIKQVFSTVPLDELGITGEVALALECSGHEQAVLDACQVVCKKGEVVLIGVPWQQKTDITAHQVLHSIFHRYIVLRSGWEWELPLHPTEFRVNSIFDNLAAALQWLKEKRVQVKGLYGTIAPQDAQQAYHSLLHRTEDHLALVFDWQ